MSDHLLHGHSRQMDYGGLDYICGHYRVPAKPDGRVIADGQPGRIVGTTGHYLRVLLDAESTITTWHPTWHMEYLDA